MENKWIVFGNLLKWCLIVYFFNCFYSFVYSFGEDFTRDVEDF